MQRLLNFMWVFLSLPLLTTTFTYYAYAQSIKIDNTTQTVPNTCDGTCTILGGLRQDNNLFHSFEEFNVNANSTVLFNDPGVRNILGRVTGNNRSNILGKVGVDGGNANLFLINPNGFLFGPKSSLDVSGSFIVTTANSIEFGNENSLDSTASKVPKLSVNPTALFIGNSSGRIINLSKTSNNTNSLIYKPFGLQVPNGKSLLMIGGEIELDGGGLNAPGGKVELASLSNQSKVNLNLTNDIYSLESPNKATHANVSIKNSASLNVAFDQGGDIAIYGNDIFISGKSILRAGIENNLGTPDSKAGNIVLNASQNLILTESKIFNRVWNGASGQAGPINISANHLDITHIPGSALDDTRIDASSFFGSGNAGNITINAKNVKLGFNSFIFSNLVFTVGNGGLIKFDADNIYLDNKSGIQANNIGSTGNAGSISIKSKEQISLGLDTQISSQLDADGKGDLGVIKIHTPKLSLTNGAQISTSLLSGTGTGGDIVLDVPESIVISGFGDDGFSSGLVSVTRENARGNSGNITANTKIFQIENAGIVSTRSFNNDNAGNINIYAHSFIAKNGGQILNNAFRSGDAGNINIHAEESINISGVDQNFSKRLQLREMTNADDIPFLISTGPKSGLFAGTSRKGNGGDITLTTNSFGIFDGAVVDTRTLTNGEGGSIFVKANSFITSNGGQIVSTTQGSKPAGDITLEVLDSITLYGKDSGIFANTTKDSTGSGGNINIDPKLVLLQNGAEISVNSAGAGSAGSLALRSNNLTLDSGTISATSNSNTGGNISLSIADTLLLRDNSQISTTASGQGTGGKININADFLIAAPTENSDITANALNGPGGQITINTKGIVGLKVREQNTNFSDITAISQNNPQLNGTVNVNTPETDPSDNLSEQPETVEPPQEIAQGCRPGQSLGGSTFVNVGRGGLPQGPQEAQTPPSLWQDLRAHNLQPSKTAAPTPTSLAPPPEIVEAKGWAKDTQGRIYLTASASQPSSNPLQPTSTC